VLKAVANSFTETPEALQKSALVELNGQGGDLVVIDRSKRSGITGVFQEFLGVRRKHSDAEMTANLEKAVLSVVKAHRDELPLEITSRVKDRLLDTAERKPEFDAGAFFQSFFGPYGSEGVRASFEDQLDKAELRGESFSYDRSALPRSGQRTYRTNEGVKVTVPEGAADTISFREAADGTTEVTIRTRRVYEA
jgi:hypothetical protein